MRRDLHRFAGAGLLLFPLVFLGLFFFFPVLAILREGLTGPDGRPTLRLVAGVIADPYYLRIIGFTVEQALLSTLASILLGLPGAYFLASYSFRGKSVVKAITTVPFVLPSIIVVLGFVIFFGNAGVLNRALMAVFDLERPPLKVLYSMRAIILAHTFYNFPICINLVAAAWSRINPNLERAARSLGARGLRLFGTAVLPQIMPGILSAAALIFIFCYTSFAVILVLSGGPRFTTIEVEIYRLARVELDLNGASALAIWQALFTLLFMYVYIRLQRRASHTDKVEIAPALRPLGRLMKSAYGPLVAVYLAAVFGLIIAPMLSAVNYSFLQRSSHGADLTYTLRWYRLLFSGGGGREVTVSYLGAVLNSLFFGALAVAFSVPLGTAIAWLTRHRGGVLESMAMLPLGISSVMLGLGYLRAFQTSPVPLIERWYAVAFAHTVIAYPFVVRSASAVLRRISPGVVMAARSLGASRWRTFWRVELPLIRTGLIAGATFAFAISIGEINATLMLYNPEQATLPIAIYRLISAYNYFGACALGTVLILICFAVFFIIERLGVEVA
jgi:thiamine transport system permease protein